MGKPIGPWGPDLLSDSEADVLLAMLPRGKNLDMNEPAIRVTFLDKIEDVRLTIASAHYLGTTHEPTRAGVKKDRNAIEMFQKSMQEGVNAIESLRPRDRLNLRPESDHEFNSYLAFPGGTSLDIDNLYINLVLAVSVASERIDLLDRENKPNPLTEGEPQGGRPKDLATRHAVRRLASLWTYLGGSMAASHTQDRDSGKHAERWDFFEFARAVLKTVPGTGSAYTSSVDVRGERRKAARDFDKGLDELERRDRSVAQDSETSPDEHTRGPSIEHTVAVFAKALDVDPSNIQEMLDEGMTVMEILASVMLAPT